MSDASELTMFKTAAYQKGSYTNLKQEQTKKPQTKNKERNKKKSPSSTF